MKEYTFPVMRAFEPDEAELRAVSDLILVDEAEVPSRTTYREDNWELPQLRAPPR